MLPDPSSVGEPPPVRGINCSSLKSGACLGISFVSGQTTVVVPVAVVVVVTTAVVTCVVPTDGVAVVDRVVVTVGVVVVTTVPVVETVETVVVDGVVVPSVVVVGVTIVVVSALKQPLMFGLTLYRSMVASVGCNSTIVTSLACIGADWVGRSTAPSSGLTSRSSNVVCLPSADVKITFARRTLLLLPRDTPVTCGAESALAPLRSKAIVGFFPFSLVGWLTIHFEPSYGLYSTEELSVVVLTCLSGMSGFLPSSPMTSCSGQRTVVMVPAVVALVVTVARVVVVVVGVTVEAVVDVGGVEVDAVEPAGVVAVPSVVVVPWAVVVPSAVVLVAAAVVVAEKRTSYRSSH